MRLPGTMANIAQFTLGLEASHAENFATIYIGWQRLGKRRLGAADFFGDGLAACR